MDQQEIESRLRDYVLRPGYQPVKLKVIGKKIGVTADDRPALRRAMRALVKQGQLAYDERHIVRPAHPQAQADQAASDQPASDQPASGGQPGAGSDHPEGHRPEVIGRFRRTSGGFGFVRPQDAPPSHSRQDDIYLSERDAGDAASGDLVAVLLKGRRHPHRGNPAGKLLRIVQRETKQFVGTFYREGRGGYVEVDAGAFRQPIPVGDPRAKGVQSQDKVVVEMVRFPSRDDPGEAVITEILGPRGEPGVETLSIIREYELPEAFPEAVLSQARDEARRFESAQENGPPPDRTDLRDVTVITIDPAEARDFDDAISVARLENGHWELGVHIADVAHFVPEGSPLDREARERATSIYLPDRVIPMIPELISNGLASLQPERERFTKSAVIEFTEDGAFVATELKRSVIRSDHRFTYEEVDEFLADPESFRDRCSAEVFELLGRMRDLSRLLRQRRYDAGKLELSIPELKVELDPDGRVVGAHKVENTESHQIIEEFMLSANEAVARELAAAEYPFLRRVHPPPELEDQETAAEFVRELGFEVETLVDRFQLQALLEEIADDPRRYAISYAILRSLKRAVYSPEAEMHYALNSECYCHFTSPIRRYPDLTIHRTFDALLAHQAAPYTEAELATLGEHCSNREQRAEEAERELTQLKLLHFLSERLGTELQGVITGVEEFGLFIQGTSLPAEGLVHIKQLGDDYYDYDRASHVLSGRRSGTIYRLGDLVTVAVTAVDLDRRNLDLMLVDHHPHDPPRKVGRKRPTQPEKRGAQEGGSESSSKRGKSPTGSRKRMPPRGQRGSRREGR